MIEGWLGDDKKRNLSALTFVAFAAALVAAVAANAIPGLSFSNMLIVDGFATFFRVLVIGVGILTSVFRRSISEARARRVGRISTR